MPKKKRKKVLRKKITKRKITKRKITKKRVLKRPAKKRPLIKKIKQKVIGTVTHYFPKVRAAVVKLKTPLSIGDIVKVKGHTTDFTQTVASIQIDHVPINSAKKGDEIGLLVDSRVRENDIVYKV